MSLLYEGTSIVRPWRTRGRCDDLIDLLVSGTVRWHVADDLANAVMVAMCDT